MRIHGLRSEQRLKGFVDTDAESPQPAAAAAGFQRLLEPLVELFQRIGVEVRFVEVAELVFAAEGGEGHLDLRRDQSAVAREVEEAAGIHDRAHFTERLEGINFAGCFGGDGGCVEIDGDDIAGLECIAQAFS